MFTVRNLGGVALFLFGTTYLWLTPAFAGPGVPTTGVAWSITQVLALVTLVVFTAATWGLFRKARWWEPVAVVAAAVGFVVLVPYWIAASHAGAPNPAFDVLIHALGNVGVLVLLRVPSLERWVHGHVLARAVAAMPRRRGRMLALGGLLPVAGLLYGVVARPRINQWGATDQEHRPPGPGTGSWPGLATSGPTRSPSSGPPSRSGPWLVQLGQGRGGLYSYDWLENLVGCDIHSADRILPQFQQPLRVGDRVIRMAQYAPSNPVARFEPGRALVLGGVNDADADLAAGRPTSTWAFIVHPIDQNRTRLLIRSRGSSLMGRIQGPIQFVMQRKAMVGIKQRAEGTWSPSPLDVVEPLLWWLAAGVLATASVRVLVQREQWWRPFMVAVGATVALPGLLFWQPPIALGAVADGVLLQALIGSRRPRRLAAGGRRRR